jgi:hypothetical protein
MSDLEKVVSYARQLGPTKPIQLRWEASGDSTHAANLLGQLKDRTYQDSTAEIKYHAEINLFENNTDLIYTRAVQNLANAQQGCTRDQTYAIRTGADVTRDSGSLGQNKAHIMFVRNLMGTNGHGSSETQATESLLQLHTGAVRGRSGSMSEGGELKLGMSGQPGLSQDVLVRNRNNAKAKDLFVGAASLAKTASQAGSFTTPGQLNYLGKSDFDEAEVMRNDGSSLGVKRTYYLTFQY